MGVDEKAPLVAKQVDKCVSHMGKVTHGHWSFGASPHSRNMHRAGGT